MQRRRLLTTTAPKPRPALFLDRDGVLIEDCHHLCDPDQVRLCRGLMPVLIAAREMMWPVVVITNQSGIARGLFGWDAYERVTDRMLALLGQQAPIAAIYANGHGPDADRSSWRKPNPWMLVEAAADLNLDLSASLLIGDRLSDLQAGAAAGVLTLVHVLSGHGHREREAVVRWSEGPEEGGSRQNRRELLLLDSLESFPVETLNVWSAEQT